MGGNNFYNENSILYRYCRIRILKDLIEVKMYSFLNVYLISGDTNFAAILSCNCAWMSILWLKLM